MSRRLIGFTRNSRGSKPGQSNRRERRPGFRGALVNHGSMMLAKTVLPGLNEIADGHASSRWSGPS